MSILALLATLALAFVNGANDNPKGVATLVGSGTLDYRRALLLATSATLAGSIASVFLASRLIEAFSGKGLVPAGSLTSGFLAAVALSATLTVLLATRLGMPVSTTHAILGGLAGAGFVAAGPAFDTRAALAGFAVPLALGPVAAIVAAVALVGAGRALRRRLGVGSDHCICIGNTWVPVGAVAASRSSTPSLMTAAHTAGARRGSRGAQATKLLHGAGGYERGSAIAAALAPAAVATLSLTVGRTSECRRRYVGRVLGFDIHTAVEQLHMLSGLLVSFARGMNDTPKIVGLAVATAAISPAAVALAAGLAMAIGGAIGARRVTHTLAARITPISAGRGLAANLATSLLVIGASPLGLPLSTTHVSAGGILGVGGAAGTLRWKSTSEVIAAWVATLPAAFAAGALLMQILG